MTAPDPKTVREIAANVIRAAIEDHTSDALNCLLEERGLIESAWNAGYTPWHGAVATAVSDVVLGWPGEHDDAYGHLREFTDACDPDMEIIAGPPKHDAPYLSLSDLEAVLNGQVVLERIAEDAVAELKRQQPAEATDGEQAQDGMVPEMPPPPFVAALTDKVLATMQPVVAMSVRHLLASRSVWRAHAYRSGAERDALAARVAELEAHPAQLLRADREADEADTRAVAALLHAQADGAGMAECKHVFADLRARFADRIAALDDGADDEGDFPCVWCHCDGCDECTGIHGVVCGCRNPVQR